MDDPERQARKERMARMDRMRRDAKIDRLTRENNELKRQLAEERAKQESSD